MNYVNPTVLVIDFEATCGCDNHHGQADDNEIIEIGACIVKNFQIIDRYSIFVKPVRNPILSYFCTELTTIEQADVESAKLLPDAWAEFQRHVESVTTQQLGDLIFASWGHYDKNQLKRDCDYHNIVYPFRYHVSLKHEFSKRHQCHKMGTVPALNYLGLKFEGTNHRGYDDAYNIAQIFIKEWQSTGLQINEQHRIVFHERTTTKA
jgi:inhibitor of KinA sporulation pathway (predicted exonuclease)